MTAPADTDDLWAEYERTGSDAIHSQLVVRSKSVV